MKRAISVALITFVLTSNLWGTWAIVPLDELVAEADLIVVGTLYSANEDDQGIGQGYIRVEEIVSHGARTIEDRPLQVDDSLKIKWADNWACAAGMHIRRKGLKGVWLLDVEKDGTVSAAYPGKFEELERLSEIRRLLRQKKSMTNATVDVLVEKEVFAIPQSERMNLVVIDALPHPPGEHSVTRAMVTLFLSIGLYWLFYRSRFRVR